MKRVAIFGLGYVGSVTAACLAARGHHVTGVDIDDSKVGAFNAGRGPVIEPGLDGLVAAGLAAGRLRATNEVDRAARDCDLALICVGTPSRDNGGLNLDHVGRVAGQIGAALRDARDRFRVIVLRSTVLPGTAEDLVLPAVAQACGREPGDGWGLVVNPEFLREGTSIADFNEPPRTVIGEMDAACGDAVLDLYRGLPGPIVRTTVRLAEMVKYGDNAFHALKIAFANEMGAICKARGIDSHALMEIFCRDTKLNLSPAYLKPGFAFGGSCLPKDLRALVHAARAHDLRVPLLEGILESNEAHKRRALDLVLRARRRKIGILGLSFKPGTDDLRESPAVELAETLIGKGFQVSIYDRNVSLARLVGANRAYIEREIPHLSSLMRPSLEEICGHAEVLVVTTRDPEFAGLAGRLSSGQTVIDLVRLSDDVRGHAGYQGIGW
jgi:GDP-mannose 6-dehydrogenase